MLIVNIQEFIALSLQLSAVLCIAHTFKVHRNACCREQYCTLLDACLGKKRKVIDACQQYQSQLGS